MPYEFVILNDYLTAFFPFFLPRLVLFSDGMSLATMAVSSIRPVPSNMSEISRSVWVMMLSEDSSESIPDIPKGSGPSKDGAIIDLGKVPVPELTGSISAGSCVEEDGCLSEV